ncbi:hypothetical protein THII_2382 [Thioploca ingrica]|uniref:Putative restriction endonuclease domain-containing protein n=1 Tax=Thioploca ingrica TaxID=40754 RepID=A0A090AHD8_9GAMM|nr:hypothetical protein THII_2382 [Thioploca ingrica]
MTVQPKTDLTLADYLQFERQAPIKHEYYQGEIFAMTGASRAHNLIVISIATLLYNQLRQRPCEIYANDMRVKVSTTGLYTYPDLAVVCDSPQFDDQHKDTLLNPAVLIEVLSESTERYDRGKKFEHYRSLDSLNDYLLVAQDEIHIEHYQRYDKDSWLLNEAKGTEGVIRLDTLACQLLLVEVYEKITFDQY